MFVHDSAVEAADGARCQQFDLHGHRDFLYSGIDARQSSWGLCFSTGFDGYSLAYLGIHGLDIQDIKFGFQLLGLAILARQEIQIFRYSAFALEPAQIHNLPNK
jgi:hypothetical protein